MHTILIAPTYRCNANCPYCYTNSFKNRFQKDMSFLTFLDLTNRFIKAGGKTLKFIGGEPTIWKHTTKAIVYAKLRGLRVEVLSNGLKILQAKPHTIFLNISHYFDSRTRETVRHSLEEYSKKKIPLVFRYNLVFEAGQAELTELVALAKERSAFIDIVPAVPYPMTKEMGQKIYDCIRFLQEKGVRCNCSNPLLPCMFIPEQWDYLKANIKLFSVCSCSDALLVNPDGETVLPCTKVFLQR